MLSFGLWVQDYPYHIFHFFQTPTTILINLLASFDELLQLLQGGRSQIKTDIYSKLLLWKDGIRFKFSSLIFVLFLKHVSWKSRRYFLFCFWYHMSNGASRTFWYMTWGLQNTAQFKTRPIWNIGAMQYNDVDGNDLEI